MYPKVEWLACLLMLSAAGPSDGTRKHCAEPSEERLSNKLDHWAAQGFETSGREFIPGKRFNSSYSLTLQIGERSTSPWSYRINTDRARYPRKLMEAYCLHKGCFGTDGKIDDRLLSVPYHMPVLVLRRNSWCKHKTFVYKKAVEKISLYCVCVMSKVNKS